MNSFTEENYIKAIYKLIESNGNEVSTNAIAEKINTKAASVSDMLKKLSAKKLVNYQKYRGVTLTEVGQSLALNIIRKHRLWEVFLVAKLNFTWDEVHEVAEQLEHIKSSKLINELDVLLDFPKQDPHGDPIPDKSGNLQVIEKKLLSTLSKGDIGVCVGVNDSSSEFLQFLNKQGIALGQQIKVIDKEPFDNSLRVNINTKELSISNKVANNLYIQKL